jgi:hypothetical protein
MTFTFTSDSDLVTELSSTNIITTCKDFIFSGSGRQYTIECPARYGQQIAVSIRGSVVFDELERGNEATPEFILNSGAIIEFDSKYKQLKSTIPKKNLLVNYFFGSLYVHKYSN